MPMLAPHNLPDHLLSNGVNTFTLAEAAELLDRSSDAVRKGLERLTRKRLIFSPARGFYVVVPPQFRRQGIVPATHFIDAMMQALGRRYYVSLISAAELHGAVKPAPSEPLQVMVDRHVTDRDLGSTELWFYKSSHATYDIGIQQHDGPTGPLRLASRERTAVDLVQHIDDCGGIDHVALLLDALGPPRIPKLAEIAGTRDLATARRLGYLLSHLDPNLRSAPSKNSPTSTAPPRPTSSLADHDADASTRTGTCESTHRPSEPAIWGGGRSRRLWTRLSRKRVEHGAPRVSMVRVLVLITGPTGAGKSTVVRSLATSRRWRPIRVFTTRAGRRDNDDTKIPVTRAEMDALTARSGRVRVFDYDGHTYATPLDAVEHAAARAAPVYIVDWVHPHPEPLAPFGPHAVGIVLFATAATLTRRLSDSGRLNRLARSLEEREEVEQRRAGYIPPWWIVAADGPVGQIADEVVRIVRDAGAPQK